MPKQRVRRIVVDGEVYRRRVRPADPTRGDGRSVVVIAESAGRP